MTKQVAWVVGTALATTFLAIAAPAMLRTAGKVSATNVPTDLAQATERSAQAEIEGFNAKLDTATRSMDNAKIMALWAADGISLLPSTKPLVGKAAIGEFLTSVTSQLEGARMERFEMHCDAIEVSGDCASEWCDEHQVVALPGGKPPFDGRGRILFVLHKSEAGGWLIKREMWNQA